MEPPKKVRNEVNLVEKKAAVIAKLFEKYEAFERAKDKDNVKTPAAAYPQALQEPQEPIVDFLMHDLEDAERLSDALNGCGFVDVSNISQWLEEEKIAELPNLCQLELPGAVINAQVCNEPQPDTAKPNGIDLRQCYDFLESALTGAPRKKLNAESAVFMAKMLMAEAIREEGMAEARRMAKEPQKVSQKKKKKK